MEYRQQYDEIVKHFAEGRLKEAGAIQKDLQLHNVNIASYYTDKYALWLDFRCSFQILGGCHGRRTWVGVTTVSNSLIFGGWVTKALKNGDKK